MKRIIVALVLLGCQLESAPPSPSPPTSFTTDSAMIFHTALPTRPVAIFTDAPDKGPATRPDSDYRYAYVNLRHEKVSIRVDRETGEVKRCKAVDAVSETTCAP